MNVNFWGMYHSVRLFLPNLKEIRIFKDKKAVGNVNINTSINISNIMPSYIVNTASVAGLATADCMYAITKHACVALTEVIYKELKDMSRLELKKHQQQDQSNNNNNNSSNNNNNSGNNNNNNDNDSSNRRNRNINSIGLITSPIHTCCLVPAYVKTKFFESTGNAHNVSDLMRKLRDKKHCNVVYNSGLPHPDIWEMNGIEPSEVANQVFNDLHIGKIVFNPIINGKRENRSLKQISEIMKQLPFWIHTHRDWIETVAIDRYGSINTGKYNDFRNTRMVFDQYQQRAKKMLKNRSKL